MFMETGAFCDVYTPVFILFPFQEMSTENQNKTKVLHFCRVHRPKSQDVSGRGFLVLNHSFYIRLANLIIGVVKNCFSSLVTRQQPLHRLHLEPPWIFCRLFVDNICPYMNVTGWWPGSWLGFTRETPASSCPPEWVRTDRKRKVEKRTITVSVSPSCRFSLVDPVDEKVKDEDKDRLCVVYHCSNTHVQTHTRVMNGEVTVTLSWFPLLTIFNRCFKCAHTNTNPQSCFFLSRINPLPSSEMSKYIRNWTGAEKHWCWFWRWAVD